MTISVIITTYNRAGHLNKGLWSQVHQKTQPDEILVVDDGSSDRTQEVVEGYQKQYPYIRYIYNNNPGYTNCCLAKNIGIKESRGDILIFTEPEVLYIGDIIGQHRKWHEKKDRVFVSSGTVYCVMAGPIRRMTQGEFEKPELLKKWVIKEWKDGYQPQREDIAVQRKVSATYSASIKKKELEAIGGWDERFLPHWGWDDIDMQSRISMNGVKCVSDIRMEVVHLAHGYTGCFEVWEYNKALHSDPDKPVVANQGKEWGVIRKGG